MRILEDQKAGTFTLVPVNFGERVLMNKLLAKARRKTRYEYHGHAKNSTKENSVLRFNVGGKSYEKGLYIDGRKRGTTEGFKGGTTFRLRATDDQSRDTIGAIRDMCFFATSGLRFLKKARVDGVRSIVCTGNFCKLCNSPMIGICASDDNRICDACSKSKCEHDYHETALLTPAFGLIKTESCRHCKRMSPSGFDRAKQTPKLQRVVEAQEHIRKQLPKTHCMIGKFGDTLSMTVDEAVLVRDKNAIPLRHLKMICETVDEENIPAALKIFDDIAKDFRERV